MKREQLNELIYQMLETEHGGTQVYETALRCVLNDELKQEWEEYLEQTKNHERIVLELMEKMGLDPEEETPGRVVVRHTGESLVKAMELALASGPPEAAQLVACESVVLAGAYRFSRPTVAREADLTRVIRQLLRELKRQVLGNVSATASRVSG